jgi:hypothetical protein
MGTYVLFSTCFQVPSMFHALEDYRQSNVFGRVKDRLCGPAVRVPGYGSRGPGSIPDATRFSEK